MPFTFWSVAVYLLLPYAVGNLLWRGLRYRAYWRRWPERFGFVPSLAGERVIWVHAVSVGEVRSAAPLVRSLERRYPRHRVLVTTMTPTGSEQVASLFGERVRHVYVPYDFPGAVRRFMDRARPELAIIAETEFWPTLFGACRSRNIPLVLVNVRVSLEALRGYMRLPRTTRRMFAAADLLCAQTSTDAQRLRNLGAPERRVKVTGNLKFDVELAPELTCEAAALRAEWGCDRPVLIAGSTHPGEERRLLAAFRVLRELLPELLLVLVPRHPERFRSVAELARRRGWRVARRTRDPGPLPRDVAVYVGDTMGELARLYAAADVAFVGGSLVQLGGQNLLEPCAVGVPVIFGPHMFHFEEISALVLESGAGRQVHDEHELVAAVTLYLEQPDLRKAAAAAARNLVARNRGALARTLGLVDETLGRREPPLEALDRAGRRAVSGTRSSI